ncbi:glycerate kinase family protein [Cohnella endophytica]|uniref:glycerate kinase family protein n=1 Tax=Cohnella endophytica TaxID=2419778 RepID=UPI002D7A2FF4|nr:glycerate kinase [Cohnella endophytica]
MIATDSFKGSLTSRGAGEAIARGITGVHPDWEVKVVPMADGGEGTLSCLVEGTGGRYVAATVEDAIGRPLETSFGILGNGSVCVAELASACGLPRLSSDERNPLAASTYGFGQLIRAGLDAGFRKFVLGLGGSATNDGGIGMLQALGFGILDETGNQVERGGGALIRIQRLILNSADPRIRECEWIVACDVDNPLNGLNGATTVFGPQKGATPAMVHELEKGMSHWADVMAEATGLRMHDEPGAGAAGGVAAALLALLGAKLKSGIGICIEKSGLEHELADADLIITGEGRIDAQTLRGKTPYGVLQAAARFEVPAILIGGSVDLLETLELMNGSRIIALASLLELGVTVDEAILRAAELLERRIDRLFREELRLDRHASLKEITRGTTQNEAVEHG